jgi:hypothetical protein
MKYALVAFLPAVIFFQAGRTRGGVIAMLMQITVVFWPLASIGALVIVREDTVAKEYEQWMDSIPRAEAADDSAERRKAS